MVSQANGGRSRGVLLAGGALLLVLVLSYVSPDWIVPVIAPMATIVRGLAHSPYPLGFLLALALVGVTAQVFVRSVRSRLADGNGGPPTSGPGSGSEAVERPPGGGPEARVPPGVLMSAARGEGAADDSSTAQPPSVDRGFPPSPGRPAPAAPPRRPTTHSLGLRLVLFFALFAGPALWASDWIFARYDRLVSIVGAVLYWPHPWPAALAGAGSLPPDFILLMYLCGMAAYLVAILPVERGEFPSGTGPRVAAVLVAYFGGALLLDAALDGVGLGGFLGSLHVLAEAVLGGVFFALLIFSTLVVPSPLPVPAPAGRDRAALAIFGGSVVAAVAIASTVLYLAWSLLGVGQAVVGFAVLLLLPVYTLVVWALIGLAIYHHRLRARPIPSVESYHPPVTVVIPAYNEEENIAFAIRSADAAAGLYPGTTEILVGNDGSTDRTVPLAEAALGELHHATGRLLDLPHAGKSNPLNAMLREAKGEILVRVDGDCRLSARTGFSAIIPHFADPEVGGVQGLLLPLQRNGWTRKLRFMEIAWNHLFLRRAQMAFRGAEVVDGAFCAFRRKDLVEAGGWVEWNGEDTEITLRLLRRGFRMRLEERARAFEDVPPDLRQLKKQRIRWSRGGIFAYLRHYGALFGGTPEFGGIAIAVWLAMFARGGMRQMIYVYAALATAVLALPTLQNLAVIVGLLFAPRAVVIAIQAIRLRFWSGLAWLPIWPAAGVVKQYFVTESFGTMLPGLIPELFE